MARVTAQDVAEAAGVSLTTVDRVLNNRKGVRESTIERVMKAMDQRNFVRDQTAANLARRRSYTFNFIVPSGETSFFAAIRCEIETAKAHAAKERIDINMIAVPPLDPHTIVDAVEGLPDQGDDGVALVATESLIVRDAINRLRRQGVRVVTFISDVPNSARDRFVGIDNVSAGRVAASLLKLSISAPSGDVAIVAGSGTLRDHVERRMGFEQVMRAECPHLTVLPWIEGEEVSNIVQDKLGALLKSNPNVVGVYSLGGDTRGVIAAVQSAGRPLRVISTELSDHSRAAPISGDIDAVLAQNPGHEVRSAIRVLRALNDDAAINEN